MIKIDKAEYASVQKEKKKCKKIMQKYEEKKMQKKWKFCNILYVMSV